MQIDTVRKRFTSDEYDRMVETGIFGREDRLELVEGEILQMSPIGSRHEACVDRAAALLLPALQTRAIVRAGGSIRLSNHTKPQPDLALLKFRADYYASTGATATDTLLVIEVADASLRYDRGPKLAIYAKYGIPEVWIEDLTVDRLFVFRDARPNGYATALTLQPGDSVPPAAFPEIVLTVSELLGV